MGPASIIFGTGFLGVCFPTVEEAKDLVSFLSRVGISRIDTARRYPAIQPGKSEELLGEARAADHFVIDTKINVSLEIGIAGSLNRSRILESVKESLATLGLERVNVLYCHMPDPETPIEETAAAFDEVYKQGKFRFLGVANYNVDQIEDWIAVCSAKGYIKPTVYQGQYNAICRRSEAKLFPTLRKYRMVYNAYSPLAGGFLTGKPTLGSTQGTRFEPGSKMGAAHAKWYDKPVMHAAIRDLQEALSPRGLSLSEVSMRWLAYHSMLREEDGIIIGGSKFFQIQQNVRDVAKGPLDKGVMEMVENLWEHVKDEAP